MYTNCQF